MIELRWVTREFECTNNIAYIWFEAKDVLQYRQTTTFLKWGLAPCWSEWKDVPHEEYDALCAKNALIEPSGINGK